MTRIGNIPEELKALQKLKEGQKNNEAGGDLFKQTFEKVLSNTEKQTNGASPLPPLGEISPVNLHMAKLDAPGVGEKTDKLLNMLDKYTEALANPEKTLKEIEPLLQNIKKSAAELSLEADGADNPGLKSIADRSALTANVEYIKFMRGDYV